MENTAVDIAFAVRAGTLTARAAAEAALARIETSQPSTNAWQVIRAEAALAEADAVDARADRADLPLAGVPVAIKDNVTVAGEPYRDGTLGTDPAPQPADDESVRRLRDAGAVVVGITRVPEMCIWGATDSAAFGVTRNPWDLDRTPGGSSGGSAAALAAGDVPIAHGSDGMGSIRIPSAACGLVGLKPGRGVVPINPPDWNGMSSHGPMATTVADAALMLGVLTGDPSYGTVTAPGRLRVAVSLKAPAAGTPVAAAWKEGVRRTMAALAGEHEIVERTPRYPASLMTTTALQLWTTGAAECADLLRDESALERRNKTHIGIGRALAKRGFPRSGGRDLWRARATEFFGDVDVLMTPTLAQPPIRAKEWSRTSWITTLVANARYAPFAAPWNIIGWPAMNVPTGRDEAGRPTGVQLVGKPGSEKVLLGLAAQIERVQPWQRTAAL